MNQTPMGERIHIGLFGKRNAGKSSLVNAITGQDLSVVSETLGTTTDPVMKAMELLPLGPVMVIDTPGYDDEGNLGELRVKKTKQVLNKTDIALLIVDASAGITEDDEELISLFKEKEIPYIIVYNKADSFSGELENDEKSQIMLVSAKEKTGIHELKEKIGTMVSVEGDKKKLVGDLVKPNDFVVLVVPIDSAAPKGRLILPQQMAIRDLLDADATAVVVKEVELEDTLANIGKKPAMVITDSQVFGMVDKITPKDIPLTSFSILMARYKGLLDIAVDGARALDALKDGDKILISEGCTHHRQCDDIGTVKLPKWIREYTGKDLVFETSSGHGFPDDLSEYALIVHCGGCMLNEREVRYRMKCAKDSGVPITNYGICIAYLKGILERSIEVVSNSAKSNA